MSYMLRMLRREEGHARRRGKGRADINRGTWPDVDTVASDVPVKVRPTLRATTEVSSGGEQVSLHLYEVELDYAVDVRRGDVVNVTASADPLLEDRWLTAVEVVADEWQASRIVICQESRQ